ncbi:collagen alpha-1(II) chain-like [Fukomys damarensis]|uniref:collagen alpha-1(II) chain-like n=1 Tax=Fukomys damarensis TaxID=885580 RepID=UPI0008FF1279|nr:collagen alpha-1(II) chain-like [Fukomys damarensis]
MSRATGPGALSRQSRSELAAKVPGRWVGPSRSGWPWGRRWGTGASRRCGARRRARASIRKTRRKSAERLQDCPRPWGKRQAAETADAAGENETLGTSGVVGSIEAARDPKAVWVNGAVGEPEVVGPAGSVWVTRSEEEEAGDGNPQGCERKGRPGAIGHESILELWLKVQAMRAASGCGERSRVELHPMPAEEGPVERGIPGRASWIETSRGGITGPWVRGQARAFPQVSGLSIPTGLGLGCETASGSCGHRQAGNVPPPVVAPGAVEVLGSALNSSPWERPQVVGKPEAVEMKMGCETAPDQLGRGQSVQVPGAAGQEAFYGPTPGLWRRGQAAENLDAVMVPRAVVEETASVCAPDMWQRRQEVEGISSEGLPGVRGTGQLVGVPCATTKEETRCGDLGFREKGQDMCVEMGSGGDPVLWAAAQSVEPSGPGEQEASSQQVPQGLWGVEQAMEIPRSLGKETDYMNVPGLWGTGQLPGVSQAVVVPETRGEGTSYGGVPDLWERQQVLRTPLAEAVEEPHSANVLSLWERRQAMGEQESLVPGALGAAGPMDEEAGYGVVSCLCERRRALGVSEAVGMLKAADVARHRSSPARVPTALGAPRSGRVPAAVWVSGPMCQESSSRDVLNPWERAHGVRVPGDSGGVMASEELWSVGEDNDSGAFPGPWGRRQALRVPATLEAPGPMEVASDSGDFSGSPERRHVVRIPVTVGVFPAGGRRVVPRTPRPGWEETGSGSGSDLCGERQADTKSSTRMGVSASRMLGPEGERTGSGYMSALSGSRQTTGISVAVGQSEPMVEETLSEGLLGLSGKRQIAGMPVAARLSMAPGVPTASRIHRPQMVRESTFGDGPGTLRGRQVTEAPAVAKDPGSVEWETGSEDVSGLWRRRHDGPFPEASRVPVPLGRVEALGIPVVGCVPASVGVTGSSGEEGDMGISGLSTVSRQYTERAEPSGEQTGEYCVVGN